MGSGAILSACGVATGVEIPASLKAPCVSTVDVSGAQTVGDLGRALIQADGDLRVCSVQKEAVVTIAERDRSRWRWPWDG